MFDTSLDDMLISQTSIADQRKVLNDVVEYFKSKEYHDQYMNWLSEERHLSRKTIDEHDIFFVLDNSQKSDFPDWIDESTGMVRWDYSVYAGRFVYPIKDVMGDVMGFCGWDKFDQPKYLDSKNYGYNAKKNILYGMELLPEYYRSNRKVFLIESIVDSLILRENGFYSLSSLGSTLNSYQRTILSRFKDRLVVIPDNDNVNGDKGAETAGNAYVKSILYKLPEALVFQTTSEKDIDDVIRLSHDHKQGLLSDLQEIEAFGFLFDSKELIQRTRRKR